MYFRAAYPGDGYGLYKIDDFERSINETTIIVPDNVNGNDLRLLGGKGFMLTMQFYLECSKTERIYLPWSIFARGEFAQFDYSEKLRYVILCSNHSLVTDFEPIKNKGSAYVITNYYYEKALGKGNSYLENQMRRHYLPANIAFLFNHAGNPNEGYFFIDLIEESGKIMKPPYDPRREGFIFQGWYKDAECTERWDFETDEITIRFDEEGNRIYEEIRLYADWEEQRDYGEDLIYPENIAFMLNYEGAPNNGYYYTSSKHSTGTINEPIKPKRVGCIFEGWYKDAECTEAWNFETDEITIQFDEQGNHIYEEIRLYAKWTVK